MWIEGLGRIDDMIHIAKAFGWETNGYGIGIVARTLHSVFCRQKALYNIGQRASGIRAEDRKPMGVYRALYSDVTMLRSARNKLDEA